MRTPASKLHLVLIVTVPVSTIFFRGQVSQLRKAGFRVTFICSPGQQSTAIEPEGGEFIGVPMEREISPFKDLISLWRLWRVLRRIRPDITNVGTPKAGLLGGLAARLAGIPNRIYTLHGLRLETTYGARRWLLTQMERIACWNAQYVRCVSASVRDRAIQLKLVNSAKAYVLGAGSANGIDVEQFRRTPERMAEAAELRRTLGIPEWARVIGFVGRFTRDKGIAELYKAFIRVKQRFPDVHLLLLGDFEEGDPVNAEVRRGLETEPGVILAGMVSDTPKYYAAMDVLALPTHREGFGLASIEAQATGLPVVTTRVTGAVDSVVDGVTGLLVAVQDEAALADALCALLEDPARMKHMGQTAAEWVSDRFDREMVWEELIKDYRRILQNQKPSTTEHTKEYRERTQTGFPGLMKAVSDRVGVAALLVGLSPVLAVIALLIRIKLGSPVLFRQQRPGKDGKIFELVKFRTMTDARDKQGSLLPDEARMTGLGRWLRSLSLDELPQLWNVVRGDLSFVGPRPLLVEYLKRYTPEQARRHAVKPGITGWAQVNGRNAITWEEKFALDSWYVEHWSLWLDMKILALTIWRVMRRHGIAQSGHATMPEFKGEKASGAKAQS
jgi:lipopolysaccharide/colanic/teichoic acid biosynthesis glycosyltransferase/glycosyltransferase involved in cell wall biosynthesis